MSNPYYNHVSGVPASVSFGSSPAIRAEFDSVASGFDALTAYLAGLAYVLPSGSIGVGVTPTPGSTGLVIQFAGAQLENYGTTDFRITQNAVETSGGTYTKVVNGYATLYRMAAGQHVWYSSATGTGTFTFTQRMTLDQNGNLSIATAGVGAGPLTVASASPSGADQIFTAVTVGPQGGSAYGGNGSAVDFASTTNNNGMWTGNVNVIGRIGSYITSGGSGGAATNHAGGLKFFVKPSGNAGPVLAATLGDDFSFGAGVLRAGAPAIITSVGGCSYLFSSVGGTGDFRQGFGVNLFWDGSNWHTANDGASNGGTAVLGKMSPACFSVYVIPNTGGADQTFNAATMATYMRFNIDSNGQISTPNSAGNHAISSTNNSSVAVSLQNLGATNAYGLDVSSGSAAGSGFQLIRGISNGVVVFSVRGDGNVVNTNNSYGAISDAKFKDESSIVDAPSQWNDIRDLRYRKYTLKADAAKVLQIGLIAQETEKLCPGLVFTSADMATETVTMTDEHGHETTETRLRDLGTVSKSINYSVLYMKGMVALSEALKRIEDHDTRLHALETFADLMEHAGPTH